MRCLPPVPLSRRRLFAHAMAYEQHENVLSEEVMRPVMSAKAYRSVVFSR